MRPWALRAGVLVLMGGLAFGPSVGAAPEDAPPGEVPPPAPAPAGAPAPEGPPAPEASPAPEGAPPAAGGAGLASRYLGPDDVKGALDVLVERAVAAGKTAGVVRYGTSAAGRPLLALRVGPSDAPTVFVHGGLGARDAAGTVAAVAFAEQVVAATDPNSPVAPLAYLVVPAPNPDALAAFLSPALPGLARQGGPDVDRDRDGRVGEDGPDDLDGDGAVLWMRRPARDGAWDVDLPEDGVAVGPDGKVRGDARAMREVGVDVRRARSFHAPVPEGKDDDGDGEVNEDPPGTDLARNLMGVWEEMGAWPGDGPFPGSAPEAKALLDLSWETSSLCAWYGFASEGPFLLRASERGNAAGVGDADVDDALYARLAPLWTKAAGGVEVRKASSRPGAGSNPGSDLDWAARHLGVTALRVPVWRIAKEEAHVRDRREPDEIDWLLWNDRVLGGAGFVPWREVAHPQWGTVEVGGWRPFSRFEPPPSHLEAAVAAVASVPLVHAAFAPRLALRVEVKALGPRVASVTVRVENVGGGPTDPAAAEKAKRATPVRVTLAPATGAEVLGGPTFVAHPTLAPGAASPETTWIVRHGGAGGGVVATVRAGHRVAGRASAEARTP